MRRSPPGREWRSIKSGFHSFLGGLLTLSSLFVLLQGGVSQAAPATLSLSSENRTLGPGQTRITVTQSGRKPGGLQGTDEGQGGWPRAVNSISVTTSPPFSPAMRPRWFLPGLYHTNPSFPAMNSPLLGRPLARVFMVDGRGGVVEASQWPISPHCTVRQAVMGWLKQRIEEKKAKDRRVRISYTKPNGQQGQMEISFGQLLEEPPPPPKILSLSYFLGRLRQSDSATAKIKEKQGAQFACIWQQIQPGDQLQIQILPPAEKKEKVQPLSVDEQDEDEIAAEETDEETEEEEGPANIEKISMEATAYTDRGLTASGDKAGPEFVAVDPKVIPLGSFLYVRGRCRKASDTGRAIKGKRIDIWLNDDWKARKFGRRPLDVLKGFKSKRQCQRHVNEKKDNKAYTENENEGR